MHRRSSAAAGGLSTTRRHYLPAWTEVDTDSGGSGYQTVAGDPAAVHAELNCIVCAPYAARMFVIVAGRWLTSR